MDTDYVRRIQQQYMDIIDEAKRRATPAVAQRVGYSSPLAAAYLQRRVAEPLTREMGQHIADVLYRSGEAEKQRALTREGWAEQARQQALARQWESDRALAQQAYDERIYARNLAEQQRLAEELAQREEEERNQAFLWQLIPSLLSGAGMALAPATFGLSAVPGLAAGLGRFALGALGGPQAAAYFAARGLGYGNPYRAAPAEQVPVLQPAPVYRLRPNVYNPPRRW